MKFSSPKKLNKIPLGEARCFSSIQFFNSSPPPPFQNTVSQDTFGTLSLTV